MPMLQVDGKIMKFNEAIKYVKEIQYIWECLRIQMN